jgi:undecaprenyl-diphosphatase
VDRPALDVRADALRARAREGLDLLRRLDRPLALGLVVAVAAAGAFAKLADELRDGDAVARFDRTVGNWAIHHRTDALVSVMRQLTRLGNPPAVVAVVALVAVGLAVRRHVSAAVLLVSSSAGTAVLVGVAKLVVARPRPPVSGALVVAHGYSFPSGHAAQSVACYGALAVVAYDVVRGRRARVAVAAAAGLLAAAVGLSRIVLGVHWASDVVAGWTVALGWLAFAATSDRLRRLRRDGTGPLRPAPGPDPGPG